MVKQKSSKASTRQVRSTDVSAAPEIVVVEGSWHIISGIPRCAREVRELALTYGRVEKIPGYGRKKLGKTPPLSEPGPELIYFIQAGASGHIKIGYTSRPVAERLAQLQGPNPERLYVRGTMPGDRSVEAKLHQQFQAHRRNGEWFEPHRDLIQFINDHRE